MWANDIAAAHNGQAKKDGATLAPWDTTKKSKEHREFSNLVTLETAKIISLAYWPIYG